MDFISYPFKKIHPIENPDDNVKTIKANQLEEPEQSFVGVEVPEAGKQGLLIDRDSGSACCVPIKWKDSTGNEQSLLLGFSHRKGRKGLRKKAQYNYVSRVYAFEPYPPFNIVARSGFFCLGFVPHTSDEARQSDNEQIFGATNYYKLRILKELFDCPEIHFVTGVVEKLGDETRVIVSYGVNDCYPRMMEVEKDYLVSLLRPAA